MAVNLKRQKSAPGSMRRFRNWDDFVVACERKEIPRDLCSPGAVAADYGITRQAVHDAMWGGRVKSIYVEGGYCMLVRSSCVRTWGGVD